GEIVCNVSLTHPGLYPGCVPLNIFGVGAPSQEAINWVLGESIWKVENDMDIISGEIGGEIFSTWAGPVTLVVGGEYREQELDQSSNADPTIPLDLKGLRGVPPFVQQYNIVNVGTAKGKLRVKEAFMETLVPLIANKPLIESLDFNGAVRYTDYSVSGGVTTWKTGLIWNLNEELTIRSALSRDIRAPSLYEFFSGSQQGQRIFLDPHTGTVSVAATDSSGNLELQPEEATTKTLGFIYQPSWMDRLGIS